MKHAYRILGIGLIVLLSLVAVINGAQPVLADPPPPPDPSDPGPYLVNSLPALYEDSNISSTQYPDFVGLSEVRAWVRYPLNAPGRRPLVILLHGKHGLCYDPVTRAVDLAGRWPCVAPYTSEIYSYQGYDYIAQKLAGYGYIVVSISANGISSWDDGSTTYGMHQRAELIQYHLDKWFQWNSPGGGGPPFGTQFSGKVDLQNVGLMGHSRGGEGVIWSYEYNTALPPPPRIYGIKAVLPMAPLDYWRHTAYDVPLGVLLSYCDGDVFNLDGVHYYDDARYKPTGADLAPKHTFLVMGANHNFYNTIWSPLQGIPGSKDDWRGSAFNAPCGLNAAARLNEIEQRAAGLAYIMAFFRAYLGGEAAMYPYLTGAIGVPPSAGRAAIHVSYQAPNRADLRLLSVA